MLVICGLASIYFLGLDWCVVSGSCLVDCLCLIVVLVACGWRLGFSALGWVGD